MFKLVKSIVKDETSELAQAAQSDDLVTAVFDLLPVDKFAGKLDGHALICLVMMYRVLGSSIATRARDTGTLADREELELIFNATDTIPVGDDPDVLQSALVSFVRGDVLERCRYDFFVAAYQFSFHPTSQYPNIVSIYDKASAFLREVLTLLTPEDKLEDAPSTGKKKKTRKSKSAPTSPRKTSTAVNFANASVSKSNHSSRSTSPKLDLNELSDATKSFYNVQAQDHHQADSSSAPSSASADPESLPKVAIATSAAASPLFDVDFDLVAALMASSSYSSTGFGARSSATSAMTTSEAGTSAADFSSSGPDSSADGREEFNRKLLAALDLL